MRNVPNARNSDVIFPDSFAMRKVVTKDTEEESKKRSPIAIMSALEHGSRDISGDMSQDSPKAKY
jgi:hypothetical protein